MRMYDKPTVAAEISIAAPPARVWELVTDLQLMGHWSPEYQGGEWLDGAPGPIVGVSHLLHTPSLPELRGL